MLTIALKQLRYAANSAILDKHNITVSVCFNLDTKDYTVEAYHVARTGFPKVTIFYTRTKRTLDAAIEDAEVTVKRLEDVQPILAETN